MTVQLALALKFLRDMDYIAKEPNGSLSSNVVFSRHNRVKLAWPNPELSVDYSNTVVRLCNALFACTDAVCDKCTCMSADGQALPHFTRTSKWPTILVQIECAHVGADDVRVHDGQVCIIVCRFVAICISVEFYDSCLSRNRRCAQSISVIHVGTLLSWRRVA